MKHASTMKQDLKRYGIEYVVTVIWSALLLIYCKIELITHNCYSNNYYPDCPGFILIVALLMWLGLKKHCTSEEYGIWLIIATIVFVLLTKLFYSITKVLGVW